MAPIIYHGTPMTPAAALQAIMPGRAACVSFFRPDNLEALLAICPQLMFRSRRIQLLDEGPARRARMGRVRSTCLVARLLSVAGAADLPAGSLGDHARQSWSAIAVQRWPVKRLAIRTFAWRPCLAHGRLHKSTGAPVRSFSSRLHRMDRRSKEAPGRVLGLPPRDGQGCRAHGQSMAPAAHVARDSGCFRLPIHQRRQHEPGAEWASIPGQYGSARHLGSLSNRSVGRAAGLCRQIGGEAP